MKKTIVSLSLLAALGMGMSAANAASTGTITFNGELTDTTCDVDVNG
ncbi:type 1 fimbrial protein, partial [Klebsiella aerogenes]